MWDELARRYGPLVGLRVNRELIVLVSGHDAVKQVLTRDDCNGRPDGFFFRMRTFNKVQGISQYVSHCFTLENINKFTLFFIIQI